MKVYKNIFLFVCIVVLLFSFCGCNSLMNRLQNGIELPEEYASLYSESIHTLQWCRGVSNGLDKVVAPYIEILETDDYGRILFEYSEGYVSTYYDLRNWQWKGKGFFSYFVSAILVAQRVDDDFIYYYPDVNYLCRNIDAETYMPVDVSDEELEILKINNNWNKEMDSSSCVRAEYDVYIYNYTQESDMLNEIYGIDDFTKNFEEKYNCLMQTYYLTKDNTGLVLGSMKSYVYSDSNDIDPGILIIFIIAEDGSYKYLDNSVFDFDKFSYRDAVIHLKEMAGWEEAIF